MTADRGSAGTASDRYKVPDDEHPCEPTSPEHGLRPACRSCGRPLAHPSHRAPCSERKAS